MSFFGVIRDTLNRGQVLMDPRRLELRIRTTNRFYDHKMDYSFF
jgi:hypothetical protein